MLLTTPYNANNEIHTMRLIAMYDIRLVKKSRLNIMKLNPRRVAEDQVL